MVDQIPKNVCDWCNAHNYSEPVLVNCQWWAFAGNDVMPAPIQINQAGEILRRFQQATVTFAVPPRLGFSKVAALKKAVEDNFRETVGDNFNTPIAQFQKTALTAFKVPIEILQNYVSSGSETCSTHLNSRYGMPPAIAHARVREFQQHYNLDEAEILRLLKTGEVIVSHSVLCRGKTFRSGGSERKSFHN